MPAELLDEDDNLTPKFEQILQEIFRRFDKDQDGALNSKELDAFAIATNGETFNEETLEEIAEHLNVNEEGALTLKGFYQLYHLQTTSEIEETWRDLKKHGYNEELELEPVENNKKE